MQQRTMAMELASVLGQSKSGHSRTSRLHACRIGMAGCVVMALAWSSSPAQAAFEMQSFDNGSAAAAAGWTGSGNTSNDNDFGFSDTNHTLGSSPAGEAGGSIARGDRAYYADTTLQHADGRVSMNDTIHGSGEFITASVGDNFGHGVFLGHFNDRSTQFTGNKAMLGFAINDLNSTEVRARVSFTTSAGNVATWSASGSGVEGSGASAYFLLDVGTAYTFAYNYNPGAGSNGEVVFEMFDNGVSMGTITGSPNEADRTNGAFFYAFGLTNTQLSEPVNPSVADMFIDNALYTVPTPIPEPTSLALVSLAAACLLGRRRK